LSWAAEWASGFRLDPPGQSLDRMVSRLVVAPGQSTTYRLTAQGLSQPFREITVAAGAVIAGFGLTARSGKPDDVVLAWRVECGVARLEVWHGDGPAPGQPKPVPAGGGRRHRAGVAERGQPERDQHRALRGFGELAGHAGLAGRLDPRRVHLQGPARPGGPGRSEEHTSELQ